MDQCQPHFRHLLFFLHPSAAIAGWYTRPPRKDDRSAVTFPRRGEGLKIRVLKTSALKPSPFRGGCSSAHIGEGESCKASHLQKGFTNTFLTNTLQNKEEVQNAPAPITAHELFLDGDHFTSADEFHFVDSFSHPIPP